MRNVPALTWREINSAFFSPLAYIVLTIFLFFGGFFFYLFLVYNDTLEATASDTIVSLLLLFLVATPFLTMRLLSEEYRSGTIEILMTAPVTDAEVVLSKFFGAVVFFLFMLLPTLAYMAILRALGKLGGGPVFAAYAGLFLMGCQFIALGLFCSAVTRSQIVAGIMAFVMLVVLWVMGEVGAYMTGPFAPVVEYAGTLQHLKRFSDGRIAFRDAFYFVSVTCFWLFLCVRILESRRWR